jgi:hypothetical protein
MHFFKFLAAWLKDWVDFSPKKVNYQTMPSEPKGSSVASPLRVVAQTLSRFRQLALQLPRPEQRLAAHRLAVASNYRRLALNAPHEIAAVHAVQDLLLYVNRGTVPLTFWAFWGFVRPLSTPRLAGRVLWLLV